MAAPVVENAVVTALRTVIHRVHFAAEQAGRCADDVRVVAVSKTKPISLIRQVYDAGHRCFGENYVQEIIDKAPQLPDDINWHFIGHLQSNKVKNLLAAVPSLSTVEGVENTKVANHLDREISRLGRLPLRVFVQVNTSGEESKYGIDPSECFGLVKHVKQSCPNLKFSGLMTIGMPDYSSTPENFQTLLNCRSEICKVLGMEESCCGLSMGMSGDFEQALVWGQIPPLLVCCNPARKNPPAWTLLFVTASVLEDARDKDGQHKCQNRVNNIWTKRISKKTMNTFKKKGQ